MPDVQSQSIDVGGSAAGVLQTGSGEFAIVLLHGGLPGASPYTPAGDLWLPLIHALGTGLRIITIDLPGTGGTPLRGLEDLTIAGSATRIAEILDALGVRRAIVVGHGEASLAALELARRASVGVHIVGAAAIAGTAASPTGDGIPSLTLLHPPTPLWSAASQRWALDRLSLSDAHITRVLIDTLVSTAAGDAHQGAAALVADDTLSLELQADRLGAKLMLFAYCRDVGYDVPLAVIWGAQDPLSSVSHGDGLFEVLSTTHAQLDFAVISQTGHLPHREQPRAVARQLRRLVAAAQDATAS